MIRPTIENLFAPLIEIASKGNKEDTLREVDRLREVLGNEEFRKTLLSKNSDNEHI